MGADKALVDLNGAPMIAHVARRFAPQVGALAISANGDARRFDVLGLDVIADDRPAAGPLAGVAAALAWAKRRGFAALATAPCDAPFVRLDLVTRLDARGPLAVAVHAARIEPLFALWSVDALDALNAARVAGETSPRAILIALGAERVVFEDEEGFANLNTSAELAAARPRGADRAARRL
jgi:molybdopterin-guanine dinucleotide biosynthesis protein A